MHQQIEVFLALCPMFFELRIGVKRLTFPVSYETQDQSKSFEVQF